jgi:hypothetical protein
MMVAMSLLLLEKNPIFSYMILFLAIVDLFFYLIDDIITFFSEK